MTDPSPTLNSIISLVAMTAIFAGLWANDGPGRPASRQSHLARSGGGSPDAVKEMDDAIQTTESTMVDQTTITRTISLDTEHLNLSDEELMAHLNQLPLGLSSGNYRMVDSLGGVGWLRVRSDKLSIADTHRGDQTPLLLTSTTAGEIRYIRIRNQMAANSRESVTR